MRANGRVLTLLWRTWPRVGRDRHARAVCAGPTDADPLRGGSWRERIRAQAVVADLIEVVAKRQNRDSSIDEPARPGLVRGAVDLADDFMRRNCTPARVPDRVAAVIGPSRAGRERGCGNNDNEEALSHTDLVNRCVAAALRCCLDPAAHNVKIARRYNWAIREDAMGTQDRGEQGHGNTGGS